ncbi:MAG: alpha/beta hydrolase [Muribaculaceae bacterium]|nr:alpha/beta hydrolase [Muribaculaceae bacterium]
MRKIFAVVLACFAAIAAFGSGGIRGVWKGTLMGRIPVVFNVVNDSTATMSSPAQGVSEIPCDYARVNAAGDSLEVYIKRLQLSFRGAYKPAKDEIGGVFMQGVMMPLTLVRGKESDMYPERPQTPVGPFDYREEEVSFRNGDVTLCGTLTMPSQPVSGGFPAVVLASGSGAQNRDEELFGHKPFAVLADKLTRSGVAVLRFDDRGAGESDALRGDETTMDFAGDVMAGLRYLRERPEVDDARVGILGHSEGGTEALINAGLYPREVNFVVSLAGMAVKGEELMVKQNEDICEVSGTPLKDGEVDILRRMFRVIAESSDSLELANTLRPLVAELHPAYTPEQVEADLRVPTMPWYVAFVKLDPGPYLSRIECPVLALNGTWDAQVNCEMNLGAIEAAVPTAEVVRMENLNHMFQRPSSSSESMKYGTITQTISPEVLDLIARWIVER